MTAYKWNVSAIHVLPLKYAYFITCPVALISAEEKDISLGAKSFK